jgi:hypothetical protein
MKKYILCLANSHKYNERCIAGVQLIAKENQNFSLYKKESKVKWIRPITSCEHGEIPSKIASKIRLLDIIEFKSIRECPSGFQSENVLIDESSIKIVKSVKAKKDLLNNIIDKSIDKIFLNKGKAVSKEIIEEVSNSLLFIKPQISRFITVSNQYVKNQLRVEFIFNSIPYNLPVTEVNLLENFKRNPLIIDSIVEAYFTISLGLEFEGWHFKLVAGIITI